MFLANKTTPFKAVSADSHVIEPNNCYRHHIDPIYRDRVPRIELGPKGFDVVIIDGIPGTIPLGLLAAAGVEARKVGIERCTLETMHPGGWDAKARLADQDRDGVEAEIVYPTIGMVLCNHPDSDYKTACFAAYNRWVAGFQADAPARVFGVGQTAVNSVEEAISDLRRIRDLGLRGVMMPCDPNTDFDYDDPRFDPLWEAAVALDMPLSFHILTSGKGKNSFSFANARGPKPNRATAVIRSNQDVIGTFVWGGVFDRFHKLKLVCVEAGAGWLPDHMVRLDHYYNRHRHHQETGDLGRMPSEYFRENIYTTFQDDPVAFKLTAMMNPKRLLWANDFPHTDSTWPCSQELIATQAEGVSDEERQWILRDNVIDLYNLPI